MAGKLTIQSEMGILPVVAIAVVDLGMLLVVVIAEQITPELAMQIAREVPKVLSPILVGWRQLSDPGRVPSKLWRAN